MWRAYAEGYNKAWTEAAAEIARLKAENEKLTKMVKDAYNEGFIQGMREQTTSRGGIPWHDSKFRAALKEGEGL